MKFFLLFLVTYVFSLLPEILKNSDKTKLHLVSYMGLDTKEKQQFVADKYVLVDGSMSSWRVEEYREVKKLNEKIVCIGYRDMVGNHPGEDNYAILDSHEDWFVHDTMGNRVRQKELGFYLMDLENSEYSTYLGKYLKDEIDSSQVFDGIFADDVWYVLHPIWSSEIHENCVVSNDGVTISLQHSIYNVYWNRVTVKTQSGDILEANQYSNYVTLKQSITPGTNVVVTYCSTDEIFIIDQKHYDNFQTNMENHLRIIKREIGSNLLIINGGFESPYPALSFVDGNMMESFMNGNVVDGKYQFETRYNLFYRYIDDVVKHRENNIIMVSSRLETETLDYPDKFSSLANQQMMFCYCTYLLGAGGYSNFYFANTTYTTLSHYDILEMELGLPVNEYYSFYLDHTNRQSETSSIINNNYNNFEDGSGWTESNYQCQTTLDYHTFVSGSNSIKISYDKDKCNGGEGGMDQIFTNLGISLKTNTRYTISGYIKTEGLTSSYTKIYLHLIGQKSIEMGIERAVEDYTSDWHFFSKVFDTENTLPDVYKIAFKSYDVAAGKVWFDNIVIQEGEFEYEEIVVVSRDYTKTKILVNPLETTASFLLDGTYIHEGKQISSLTMTPFTGVILTRTSEIGIPDEEKSVDWNLVLTVSIIVIGSVFFLAGLIIIFFIIFCCIQKKKSTPNEFNMNYRKMDTF